jgi:hypothetical protein
VGTSTLGWLLGGQATACATLVAVAGSDLPPPAGFLGIVAAALVLGVLVRLGVPRLHARRSADGVRSALGSTAVAGALVGAVIAAPFVVAHAFRDTSGPTAVEAVTFVAVASVLMAGGALLFAGVALLAFGAQSAPVAFAAAMLPSLLVAVPALTVVLGRLAT